MRIAIVGAGIAGLTAAAGLSRRHDVVVLEAEGRCGGHANTVDVAEGNRSLPVDTGFIVFNEANYPNLCRLFDELGVDTRDSDMSFSVRCERSGLEYNGAGLDALFVQRGNLLRPGHWRMIADILRFHRLAPPCLQGAADDSLSVGEFARRARLGPEFLERYLVPLGASLWSCSAAQFRDFPVRFVIEFLANHRMLQVDGRPRWKTVCGGSREYVNRLVAPFRDRVYPSTPVSRVVRGGAGVTVHTADGRSAAFDEVVLAVHADQALAIVESPDACEREVLAHFPYQPNEAVLHTDTGILPARRRAWASWNYRIPREPQAHVTVTYDMNRLQGLDTDRTYCVSLNPGSQVRTERVLGRLRYHHPLFTRGRAAAQAEHGALVRRRGISYCGAYWGYGFHEDGVVSALAVCDAFDATPFGA